MRIIRGKYRGKSIHPPKSFKSRPTTDFAKEALFNIIENSLVNKIENIKVLDLFSGTGSISYEFLSRGCLNVTSIEKNKHYAKFISETGKSLFGNNHHCIAIDAFKFVEKNNLDYDIIFADPPFNLENLNTIPDLVFANTSLKENTEFILEHSVSNNFKENPFFIKSKNYGKVHFTFFSKSKTNSIFL